MPALIKYIQRGREQERHLNIQGHQYISRGHIHIHIQIKSEKKITGRKKLVSLMRKKENAGERVSLSKEKRKRKKRRNIQRRRKEGEFPACG